MTAVRRTAPWRGSSFEQIFKDMKVGTDLVDVNHESIPDDLSDPMRLWSFF